MTNIKGYDWRLACKRARNNYADEIAEIETVHGHDAASRYVEQLATNNFITRTK